MAVNSLTFRTGSGAARCAVAWSALLDTEGCRRSLGRLDRGERARLAGLHRLDDRRRFLSSRNLLRELVVRQTGARPDDIHLEEVPSPLGRGKPRLTVAPWNASISHDGDLVAAAIASCRVGVDIQMTSRAARVRRLPEVFTDDELDWLRRHPGDDAASLRWTAKEALLKARGTGFWDDPRSPENDSLRAAQHGAELISRHLPHAVITVALLCPPRGTWAGSSPG